MEVWHIWVIIALIFVIIEIFTTGFAVMCISVGCLFGAVASSMDFELKWQLLAFAAGTALAFLTIRPIVCKLLYRKTKEVKTNVDALIGRRALVTERIDGELHPGRVKVDGDDWKAISSETTPLEVGEPVEIIAINSVILTVKKL
ncbi:MAG: NfeD family protein [Bacteroidales bacterium]|nr:NfeD family protein [Bacteroidales bacterium]